MLCTAASPYATTSAGTISLYQYSTSIRYRLLGVWVSSAAADRAPHPPAHAHAASPHRIAPHGTSPPQSREGTSALREPEPLRPTAHSAADGASASVDPARSPWGWCALRLRAALAPHRTSTPCSRRRPPVWCRRADRARPTMARCPQSSRS